MPLRATSIIPDENVAPNKTPQEATIIITAKGTMRVPTAEFKKLQASLLTPTNKSIAAKTSNRTTITMNNDSIIIRVSFGGVDYMTNFVCKLADIILHIFMSFLRPWIVNKFY